MGVHGEEFAVGFRREVGGGFPVENEGEGEGGVGRVGGEVGTGKGTGKSMRTRSSKKRPFGLVRQPVGFL